MTTAAVAAAVALFLAVKIAVLIGAASGQFDDLPRPTQID